jgi:isopentenyldiphosphate isomerase
MCMLWLNEQPAYLKMCCGFREIAPVVVFPTIRARNAAICRVACELGLKAGTTDQPSLTHSQFVYLARMQGGAAFPA